MKEIKFRGWCPCEESMYKFDLNEISDGYLEGAGVLLSSCHIMQFTGLKDKNGKEIYEGDIVGTWDKSRVVYDDELACFGFTNHHAGLLPMDHYGEVEVIGNIYENPELLKEKA